MFNELNEIKSTVKAGIDTRNLEFTPLSTFCGTTLRVDGFFFTNGKYGKQVVVVGNGYNVNMPKRATEVFERIYNDDKMLKAVLAGRLAITGIKVITTQNGNETVAYDLTDM